MFIENKPMRYVPVSISKLHTETFSKDTQFPLILQNSVITKTKVKTTNA